MRGLGANVKTRYAVQAAIYLARQEPAAIAPVSEIAAAVGISPKFLEDILAALRAAGIVRSRRGKQGGYQLVPVPGELSVLQVVEAMEGAAPTASCEREPALTAVTAHAFDQALAAATALLAALTIEQLADELRQREEEERPSYMYYL